MKKTGVIRFKLLPILLAGILFVFNSCSNRPSLQENARIAQTKNFVLAKDFAAGQLQAHYLKHKNQFGDTSPEEYLKMARLLLNSAPSRDILEKRRANGDILHYRVSSGEFAVMTKDGRIRTYFKADYNYWLRQ
jgi:pyocin large subunit-like protein